MTIMSWDKGDTGDGLTKGSAQHSKNSCNRCLASNNGKRNPGISTGTSLGAEPSPNFLCGICVGILELLSVLKRCSFSGKYRLERSSKGKVSSNLLHSACSSTDEIFFPFLLRRRKLLRSWRSGVERKKRPLRSSCRIEFTCNFFLPVLQSHSWFSLNRAPEIATVTYNGWNYFCAAQRQQRDQIISQTLIHIRGIVFPEVDR